jgi:hypothetical protein
MVAVVKGTRYNQLAFNFSFLLQASHLSWGRIRFAVATRRLCVQTV